MCANRNHEDLRDLADQKIEFAKQLLQMLKLYREIEGIQKLDRKIKQEIRFLETICRSNSIKKEHLQCSNLTHFGALVDVLGSVDTCIAVCKPFQLDARKIIVDLVTNGGLTWMKVIARNPKSLSQICQGNTNYGVRSILDQVDEYIECAQLHPSLFRTPNIVFVFANGVGIHLASKLESMSIQVDGERIPFIDAPSDFALTESESVSDLSAKHSQIRRVNVDVSTMLAYTSSVCNGSCNKYHFDTPVLAQQAAWEAQRPVKPLLDAFFSGKQLFCCQTARDSFRQILNVVGGPMERLRGEEFLQRIIVLPDDATFEDTKQFSGAAHTFTSVQCASSKILPIGGKVKERSLTIFTFGDRIHAVTTTSNDGFVRAAKQQGIHFVVFVHESRALTEQKEAKADALSIGHCE